MSHVFDSNILIYLLNNQLPEPARNYITQAIHTQASISVITRIEILGWSGHPDPIPAMVTDLLKKVREQPLTEAIIQQCIDLRRQQSITIPDAIIAATALHLQMPLVTRNTDDFKNIEDLSLINPFDLPTENINPEETPNA